MLKRQKSAAVPFKKPALVLAEMYVQKAIANPTSIYKPPPACPPDPEDADAVDKHCELLEAHRGLIEKMERMCLTRANIVALFSTMSADDWLKDKIDSDLETMDMDFKNPSKEMQDVVEALMPVVTTAFMSSECSLQLQPSYDGAVALAAGHYMTLLASGAPVPSASENTMGKVHNGDFAGPGRAAFEDIMQKAGEMHGRHKLVGGGGGDFRLSVVTDVGEEADDQMMLQLMAMLANHFDFELDIYFGACEKTLDAAAQSSELGLCMQEMRAAAPGLVIRAHNVSEFTDGGQEQLAADLVLICGPVTVGDGFLAATMANNLGIDADRSVVMMQGIDGFNKDNSSPSWQEMSWEESGAHFIGMKSVESRIYFDAAVFERLEALGMKLSQHRLLDFSIRAILCPAHYNLPVWAQLIQNKDDPSKGGANFDTLQNVAKVVGVEM